MTEQTTTDTGIRYEKDADGIVTLTMDDPTASANTMNEVYKDSMEATLSRLEAEKADITGVVLTSAKKTFFAGGNLKLLIAATPEDAPQMFDESQNLKKQLRRLETLGVPVVAAINGAALGGGLEIALACHRRIAAEGSYEIGLPEVTLGLLPGGGGVIRTVRMLGLQTALTEVLLQGQRRKPADAQAKGLVDEVVPAEQLLERAKAWLKESAGERGRGQAAVGPPGLQDARRHARAPLARPDAPGLPGHPAQDPQGRRLPGAARHHGRGRRGRPGRLRDRRAHRVALLHRPRDRSERQEHDPGVLLRPAGDQLRLAAPAGPRRLASRPRSACSAPA